MEISYRKILGLKGAYKKHRKLVKNKYGLYHLEKAPKLKCPRCNTTLRYGIYEIPSPYSHYGSYIQDHIYVYCPNCEFHLIVEQLFKP